MLTNSSLAQSKGALRTRVNMSSKMSMKHDKGRSKASENKMLPPPILLCYAGASLGFPYFSQVKDRATKATQ
jgi:hypothetical protein